MSFAQKFQAIFGSGTPPSHPQPQQVPGQQLPGNTSQSTQQSAQTDANGVVPQGAQNPPKPEDTLKKFEGLWNPPSEEEQKNNPTPANIEIEPAKLMEAAGKVDFSKVLNQETLAKITQGGEGAVQALVETLNKTSQTVYAQSTIAANKMVSEAMKLAEQRFADRVPSLLKKQGARDALLTENPALQNPAIQPLLSAVQEQLAEKFPKAPASEINEMAKKYLMDTANLLNPTKTTESEKDAKAKKDEDWSEYLNS